MKKSNYIKIMMILIMLIPMINQINNMGIRLGNAIYFPFIMIILVTIISKEGRKNLFSKNNFKIRNIAMIMSLAYLVAPILGLTIFKYTPKDNIVYVVLFIIFILNLYIVGTIIYGYKEYILFIKYSLLGNSILLIYNLGININELMNIDFSTILTTNRITRAAFGFLHPNTTAMYILIQIILVYLYLIKIKKKSKKGLILISILSIFLIGTGSRTANISMVLFIVLLLYLKFINNFNKWIRATITIASIIVLFLVLVYKVDISNILAASSGRDRAFFYNMNIIINNNSLLTGIAPASIEEINKIFFLDFADNWFIVQIIQFGIIGLFIISGLLLKLLYRFMKMKNNIAIILIIVMLFYSIAERVLLVPGVTLSWVFWSLLFINLRRNFFEVNL